MVVRDALGAGMPLAGVGCAIARDTLAELARLRQDTCPFNPLALTEDYELGLGVSELGGKARFLRVRHVDGSLVATRALFPEKLDQVVRQKTRWIHGIALQGWDSLGWTKKPVEIWMRLRDRRGPLTALMLALAYVLLIFSVILWLLAQIGLVDPLPISPFLEAVLWLNLLCLVWRAAWRFAFTVREYGFRQGLRAVARIPVSNIIAIMSGRSALTAYIKVLMGQSIRWDKTEHLSHPSSHLVETR